MRKVSFAGLAAALWVAAAFAGAADPPEQPAERREIPEITVQVLEEAWRVGDERTYTLLFDHAPFGRQAMRLLSLRDLPDGDREAVFLQRITLDLRALGQAGSLQQAGTVVYRRERSGPYRYQEAILRDSGYATYRDRGAYESAVDVELDPATGTYRVGPPGRKPGFADARPLPEAARAVLVDLLAVGHWERLFMSGGPWRLGSASVVPILAPSPLPRLDYHVPLREPRPVQPTVLAARLEVEAQETIDLFGKPVEVFRCRVAPPGLTLWVSPRGGVLRFEDARGLAGALEP